MAAHRGMSSFGYPSQCEERAKLRALQAERRELRASMESLGGAGRGMANRGARGETRPSTITPRTCRTAPSSPAGRAFAISPVSRTTQFNWPGQPPPTSRSAKAPPSATPRLSSSSSSRSSGGPRSMPKLGLGAATQRRSMFSPRTARSPPAPPNQLSQPSENETSSSRPAAYAKASSSSQLPESEVSSSRLRMPKSTSGTGGHQLCSNGSDELFARPASFTAPVGMAEQGPLRRRAQSENVGGHVVTDNGTAAAEHLVDEDTGSERQFEACAGRGHDSQPRGPERLRRFTQAQRTAFSRALQEIKNGRKSTCWMWFIIPTPPYVVNGVERGSSQNRRFALRSDDEARAYLNYEADGINLRSNYLEIMCAVREQLRTGKKAVSLMGSLDEPKLRSSASLFERITRDGFDEAIHAVVEEIIHLLEGSK